MIVPVLLMSLSLMLLIVMLLFLMFRVLMVRLRRCKVRCPQLILPLIRHRHGSLPGDASADWLRVMTPDPSRPMSDGLFCSLRAVEQNGGQHMEVRVDVFDSCLQGICTCIYHVDGAIAQLKPCRMYAEAICRGDEDPDWDYMLYG